MPHKSHSRIKGAVTHMDFGIRSNHLQKNEMSALLGIEPTRAFERGEKYSGPERVGDGQFRQVERIRPWGVWHYNTSDFVRSNSLNDHASQGELTKLASIITDPLTWSSVQRLRFSGGRYRNRPLTRRNAWLLLLRWARSRNTFVG